MTAPHGIDLEQDPDAGQGALKLARAADPRPSTASATIIPSTRRWRHRAASSWQTLSL